MNELKSKIKSMSERNLAKYKRRFTTSFDEHSLNNSSNDEKILEMELGELQKELIKKNQVIKELKKIVATPNKWSEDEQKSFIDDISLDSIKSMLSKSESQNDSSINHQELQDKIKKLTDEVTKYKELEKKMEEIKQTLKRLKQDTPEGGNEKTKQSLDEILSSLKKESLPEETMKKDEEQSTEIFTPPPPPPPPPPSEGGIRGNLYYKKFIIIVSGLPILPVYKSAVPMKVFHYVPISAVKVKNTIFIKNKITDIGAKYKLEVDQLQALFASDSGKQKVKIQEKPTVNIF